MLVCCRCVVSELVRPLVHQHQVLDEIRGRVAMGLSRIHRYLAAPLLLSPSKMRPGAGIWDVVRWIFLASMYTTLR